MTEISAFILLIEDNPADAELMKEALREHGIVGELLILSDGEKAIIHAEAIDAGSATPPDLIVLDLNLPKRSGREVLARFRESAKLTDAPVVVLSSSNASRDKAEATRLGASRYIRKPVRLEEFMNIGAMLREELSEAE